MPARIRYAAFRYTMMNHGEAKEDDNMTKLKRKAAHLGTVVFLSFIFAFMSFGTFMNHADQSMIAVTAINFALILFFLLFDKFCDFLVPKLQARKQNTLTEWLLWFMDDDVSFRSALYLFYIIILICLALEAVEPGLFPGRFSLYLVSIEYGILVLIAFDIFLNQFFKDFYHGEKNKSR